MPSPRAQDRPAAGRGPASRKFRRRQPSLAEQAARKAWGRKWGPILAQIGAKAREERR